MSVNSDGAASVVVDKKGPPVGGSQDVPACPNLRLHTHLACLGRAERLAQKTRRLPAQRVLLRAVRQAAFCRNERGILPCAR